MSATPEFAHGRRVRPAQICPAVRSHGEWCAWARGAKDERIEGRAISAEDALLALAVRLKELERG